MVNRARIMMRKQLSISRQEKTDAESSVRFAEDIEVGLLQNSASEINCLVIFIAKFVDEINENSLRSDPYLGNATFIESVKTYG